MHLVWFRQDLRIADNPALNKAASIGNVLPVYIFDEGTAGNHAMGAASRVWLHHSLKSLDDSLEGNLKVFSGDALGVMTDLCTTYPVESVAWNRCYEPWRIKRDTKIKQKIESLGIETHSHNASLLWEPWQVKKQDGTAYKVFTPFYRKGCLNTQPPRAPLPPPEKINYHSEKLASESLDDPRLLPDIRWDEPLLNNWDISEQGAQERLNKFLIAGLNNYKDGRNFPARDCTSRIAPYLHFGQLSPQQIWHRLQHLETNDHIDHFQSELGWREFSHSLLYQFPELPGKNLQAKFDAFPWIENPTHLKAWQKGQTGYPIVDAGMRELWQTGYMHNRLRMIVGSFLVKNLLLDWRHGERWFWDCLFDADLANNSASWQWIAGCGADAAPYFRIFNPVTQGEKFDPTGEYTRKYVPELSNLPDKFLFKPWEAAPDILAAANVELGKTYPKPIVDLKKSRERALTAFKAL